jgi:hypothetical protein
MLEGGCRLTRTRVSQVMYVCKKMLEGGCRLTRTTVSLVTNLFGGCWREPQRFAEVIRIAKKHARVHMFHALGSFLKYHTSTAFGRVVGVGAAPPHGDAYYDEIWIAYTSLLYYAVFAPLCLADRILGLSCALDLVWLSLVWSSCGTQRGRPTRYALAREIRTSAEVDGQVDVPDGEDVVIAEMGVFLSLELPPERVHMVATDKAVRAMRDTIFDSIGENQHVDRSSRLGWSSQHPNFQTFQHSTARRLDLLLSNCSLAHTALGCLTTSTC